MILGNNRNPIVVGVDGTADGIVAAKFGATLASAAGRHVVLLHASKLDTALAPKYPFPSGLGSFHRAEASIDAADPDSRDGDARRIVDEAKRQMLLEHPDLRVLTRIVHAPAGEALIAASREAVAVVVARSRGRRAERFFNGSTSYALASHALCPAIIVRDGWSPQHRMPRVVVAVEGSEPESEALTFAFQEAALTGAELVAVHGYGSEPRRFDLRHQSVDLCIDRATQERAVSEALAGWSEFYPQVKVTTEFVSSSAVDALLLASASADLLVVGANNRGGFGGLVVGSVPRAMVAHAQCPIAVVRHTTYRALEGRSPRRRENLIA